jgi:effector-binding domain-containing protein
MRRIFFLFFCLVMVCGLFLTAEEPKKEENPTVKKVPGFWCAYMDFTGPYDNMEKEINTFMGEFFKQGLIPAGPAVSAYYNSPRKAKPEDLKWAFGFTVAKDTVVKEPLKLVEVKDAEAVVYLHVGPYDKLSEAAEIAMKFVEANGYEIIWPTFDLYLNNPDRVAPEALETQLVLRVEKK